MSEYNKNIEAEPFGVPRSSEDATDNQLGVAMQSTRADFEQSSAVGALGPDTFAESQAELMRSLDLGDKSEAEIASQSTDAEVALQSTAEVDISYDSSKQVYDVFDRVRRDELTGLAGSAVTGALTVGGITAVGSAFTGAPILQSVVTGGIGVGTGAYFGAVLGFGLYGLGKLNQHLKGISHKEHGIVRTMTLDALEGATLGIPRSIGYVFGRMTGRGRK